MLAILPLTLFLTSLLASLASPWGEPPAARAWEPDSVADAFARPMAALAWPGATRSFLACPDGGLYNGVWRVNIAAGADGRRASSPRRIAYEERWRPVAHWTEWAGDVRWDFEAVALPAPEGPLAEWARAAGGWDRVRADRDARAARRRALVPEERSRMDRLVVGASHHMTIEAGDDVPLVLSVLATARNASGRARRATLDVAFAPARIDEPYYEGGHRTEMPAWAWCRPGADSALGWYDHAAAGPTVKREVLLAPGEARAFRFVVASHPLPAARLAEWARTPHATRAAAARNWWAREMARGTRFELGDPEVESAILAARVVLLECRERRGGHWVPLGGPFHYRDVYLRDGARAVAALAVHGYVAESRELAESFLEWQWPHGPFVSQGAQLDGTGQALWAIEQVMMRPAPAAGVERYAQAAYDAWSWCERARHTRRTAADEPGLLPAANPQDNELVRGQLIGSDAWALAGYAATARLLWAAGRGADAARVEASVLPYRAAFARAIARSGSRDVPPSYAGPGRDWGNLAVGYPCEALPTASPRLAAMAVRYWSRAGDVRLGFWGSPDTLHGYVAADLATWALRAGRRAEADSTLGALLFWRNASGGACELFSHGGDFGVNLPPHATSAAALLQLVRNSLVDDDGGRLALTEGARAGWWRGARVTGAPTRWGTVSLEFGRTAAQAWWKWTAVPVWTELVLPPGTRLGEAPPAPLVHGDRADVVLAPPGTSAARVRIEARSAPRGQLARVTRRPF